MTMIRRLLLAMALAVSATFLVPAGPANAGGRQVVICFQVGEVAGRPFFDCHTITIPDFKPHPIGPIECLSCPPAFDLWDRLDPEKRWEYLNRLGKGFTLLGEAAQAVDPDKIKQLRAMATDNFLASAGLLNGSEVKLDQAGWADLKNNKFVGDPDPQPSLPATGENLVAGLALMQKALVDPDPEPMLEAAMARFDQAYKDLGALHAS